MATSYALKSLHFWVDVKSPSPPHSHNDLLILAGLVEPKLVLDYGFDIDKVVDEIEDRLNNNTYAKSEDAAEAAANAAENFIYDEYKPLSIDVNTASYKDLGGDRHEGSIYMTGENQVVLEWTFVLTKTFVVNPLMVITIEPA